MTGPDPALVAAQTAAAAAATAAENAVEAQRDNIVADPASFALAENAAKRARTEADAAEATMDTAVAQDAKDSAETERDKAVMYAREVAAKHLANLDEIQRQMDVTDARMRAMASYEAADADATKADMQATNAETTAPGTPGAVAAREAATAARTAADAAKAAHDAIMDDMTKVQADAQAAEAATEAGRANAGYMTARGENEDIQTTSIQIVEDNRRNAVAAAREHGGAAADNAKDSAADARTAANAANSAADDAMVEYRRAISARTNSAKAKEHADAAHAAYMAANTAAEDAHAAYMAARAAVDGVMDDTGLEDANIARGTAEEHEAIAAGHMATAMIKQNDAEGAAMKTTMYANDHVVGLLKMANADHITTAADPDANSDDDELELIEKNKREHVRAVNRAIHAESATGDNGGAESVTASRPHGGSPTVSVDPAGDPAALSSSAATHDLGVFHELYGSGGTARAIVFTDIEPATAPREAVSAALTNAPVSDPGRVMPTGLPATSQDNSRTFPGTFDHDGDPATNALTGTFECAQPTVCSLALTGTGEGGTLTDNTRVTSIAGYRFTGSGTTPAAASMPDTTWLAFGVWLNEDVVAGATNTYTFGAFAAGGAAVETGDSIHEVTGEATYAGSAAGVHSTAEEVEFFSGNAELKARFGDGTATGTITGRIHNIMAGGRPVGDSIVLVVNDPGAQDPADNINADGGFSGRARMGRGDLDPSGEYVYRFTGTWSGNFYNHMADDTDTTTVMENTRAPGSAAGTFGVGRADSSATMDVDETESYVGAFGAHCIGDNCGDH